MIEKEERGIKEKRERPFPPNYFHGGAHTQRVVGPTFDFLNSTYELVLGTG